jgi:hypothetical protein
MLGDLKVVPECGQGVVGYLSMIRMWFKVLRRQVRAHCCSDQQ